MRLVMGYVFLSFMLTGPFVSMFLFGACARYVRPSGAEPVTSTGLDMDASSWRGFENGFGGDWKTRSNGLAGFDGFRERSLWSFGWDDKESTRLLVGVDASKDRIQDLEEIIMDEGGDVTDTISVRDNVRALAVRVPPDQAFLLAQRLRTKVWVEYVEPDAKVHASFVPNDSHWPDQWGPKKIEADWAWNTTTGSSDILVALIDTGIDYTHSDLAANYVPLGYDWVNNDADPMDDNGHGTHCAGIVAAQLNNTVGIAGIAQVRIMTEKVLDWGGWGYYSWLVDGIYHAVDAGAKILSMSLGGSDDSPALHEAVKYAHDHGALVVAAAGNTGSESPHYPAYYEEVIAVSATDSNDNLAAFSTFGDWIDLAAPGVDILSTFPGNAYKYLSGTSMACPHVTGVAALTWSVFTNSSSEEIRKVLQRTADDLGEIGFDKHFGNGRVNARRAVAGIPEHDVSITGWKQSYRLDPGQIGMFNVTVSNYGRGNETNVYVQFFVNETLVDSAVIVSLEVDASAASSFSWGTATNGVYNVTCYVVPVPGENVTENNVGHAKVAVRFPIVLRVPNDYPTIKAAVSDAYPADTVSVDEGYYAEGQIDLLKDNITLIADGHVILDGWLGCYVLNIMADYVAVDGFNIQNGTTYGINVRGYGNVITRNTIVRTRDGVHLCNSENCVLSCNFVATGGDGIDVEYSSNNTISQNRLLAGSFFGGLNLWRSSNNTIVQNTMTGEILCGAILLCLSENNFIASNNMTGNRCGLALVGSPNNVFRNNAMTNNWCNFAAWRAPGPVFESGWRGSNDVDTSNTVDGKPIYYWVNVSHRVVPRDAGCVVLVNCENITAENLDIRNNYNGILLVNSSSILIRRNNITHNWANYDFMSSGILTFDDSYNITITQNNIMTNANGLILWGPNNTVSQNNMANNFDKGMLLGDDNIVIQNNITGQQGVAVYIYGSRCIVSSNDIMANLNVAISADGSNHTIVLNNIIGYGRPFENIFICSHEGIMLYASNCTISSNNVVERDDSGIATLQASNNTIFHNNFINNHGQFYSSESLNTWDNGYPAGGNYWSDYVGVDQKKGPNQDQQGADGIGDTPKVLDVNNVDRYPLMTPPTENPPPQTYCLTITGVIGGSPIEGFYNTPYPRPGTYVFKANSSIRVDTQLCWDAFIDHWELDGVNIGSASACTVLMDKDHALKAFLSPALPLVVSIAPSAAEVKVGESMTFKSLAKGGGDSCWYQWCLNGTSVWDANSPAWTFTPEVACSYIVYLNVTSLPTTVESNEVLVIVRPQPPVCVLPTTSFKYVGDSIEFTSTVSGMNPPRTYHWYLNGSAVTGAALPTWTFTPDESGFYKICFNVTDSLGSSMMSDEASVTVVSLPTVSISPSSSSIYFGQPLQLTSSVSNGYAPYRYQWVLNGSTLAATIPSFTFNHYALGQYIIYLNVSDIFGRTEKSNEASITVKPELKISISPSTAYTIVGESITFTSTPSEGSSPESYQWRVNGDAVLGATLPMWTFNPDKPGYYYVCLMMTDESGITVYSNIATVTVFIPGDVNGDGKVDMNDIVNLSDAFGSVCGQGGYYRHRPPCILCPHNPNCDMDRDGKISMGDIVTACDHFGQHNP